MFVGWPNKLGAAGVVPVAVPPPKNPVPAAGCVAPVLRTGAGAPVIGFDPKSPVPVLPGAPVLVFDAPKILVDGAVVVGVEAPQPKGLAKRQQNQHC